MLVIFRRALAVEVYSVFDRLTIWELYGLESEVALVGEELHKLK